MYSINPSAEWSRRGRFHHYETSNTYGLTRVFDSSQALRAARSKKKGGRGQTASAAEMNDRSKKADLPHNGIFRVEAIQPRG